MYQKINTETLTRLKDSRGKNITRHALPNNLVVAEGEAWVIVMDKPTIRPKAGFKWVGSVSLEADGWIERAKPVATPTVKQIEVTKAQLRTALTDTQIAQIEEFISLIPDATLKRLAANYWEHNITYLQFDPLLVRMAAGLQGHIGSGWTPDDVATIFIAAKAITTGVNDSI